MDPVEQAIKKVGRVDFVPDYLRGSVSIDAPLPIGFGQTISQPTTVRLMLGWLEPEQGNKVLDLGSGSGWTTALLAYLVGPKGKVLAVEKVPELLDFGRQNVERLGIQNARFYASGRELGMPKEAPFDRILVSAAAEALPKKLIDQLAEDGKLVIPVGNDILEIEKQGKNLTTKVHGGFVFVPLIES